MDRWDSTPRLAFLSAEPGSGKTRAIEITELLVPNAVSAVNVSPSYLFRKTGSDDGVTILYDEIDTVFGPKAKENEEIRGLLNAGHRRGAVAGRCVVRGKAVETETAYAAVALAGIGWLPDTILSRSIIIRMRRRHAGEQIEAFRNRVHKAEGQGVRALIEAWARSVEERLAFPENLPPEIQDRDADNWKALVAVADAIGGDWPRRARDAAVALVAASKEAEPSLGIRLLADLKTVFDCDDEMSSKSILDALYKLEEAPWADLRGKPLDERGLANRLRQYGVRSKTVRIGAQTPKGYTKADLFDVWIRYLPPSTSATSATSATSQGTQGPSVAYVAEAVSQQCQESASEINDVADVADVADMKPYVCEQCRGDVDGTEQLINGHTLHRECVRFWHQNGAAA
jgi:hypothetical protein